MQVLFSDAEVTKNHVEKIFDVDPPSDTPERAQGKADVFRHKFRLIVLYCKGTHERRMRFKKRFSVAGPRERRRF